MTSSGSTKCTNASFSERTLPQRIVLTGFMGAGKTTLGSLLAQKLGWTFIDLDDEIVRAERRTIAAIFESDGEPAFRELEHIALTHTLAQSHIVLALGGGAMENASNLPLLMKEAGTLLVYLQAPLEILVARCEQQQQTQSQAAHRPVLANRAELKARFLRRLPLYQSAHWTIDTAERSADDIVQTILMEWASIASDVQGT